MTLLSEPEARKVTSAQHVTLDHLAQTGLIDAENRARIDALLTTGRTTLTRIVVDLGLVGEADFLNAVREVQGYELATPFLLSMNAPLTDLGVSSRFLKLHRILPVFIDSRDLVIVTPDPFNEFVVSALGIATDRKVVQTLARANEIEAALKRLYPDPLEASGDATGSPELLAVDIEKLRESASDAPTIRFVNDLIGRAVEARASDVHIEPVERALRIRFRIDGVLREDQTVPIDRAAAILSRLKILSGLDIAERRLPQDGAFKIALGGKQVDLRIGTSPVADGEAASVRVLDKGNVTLDLEALGFDEPFRERWLKILRRPNGIVLVTGPTGSGKTTTLYASLQQLNTVERKIVSIEDPVEYRIRGINQIQVNPEIGLTFAAAFRSILRHDPDVVFVGEIRDEETAKIAIQAALAGRLVVSTLHTNSAAGAITRLLDMGAEDYLLASTLVGVLAQRLVRKTCVECAGRPKDRKAMSGNLICEACGGSGFRGRTVIHELLVNSGSIEPLMTNRAGTRAIHVAAVAEGMETLWHNGQAKVRAGLTTTAELARVVHEEP